jgi:hypothetical protein
MPLWRQLLAIWWSAPGRRLPFRCLPGEIAALQLVGVPDVVTSLVCIDCVHVWNHESMSQLSVQPASARVWCRHLPALDWCGFPLAAMDRCLSLCVGSMPWRWISQLYRIFVCARLTRVQLGDCKHAIRVQLVYVEVEIVKRAIRAQLVYASLEIAKRACGKSRPLRYFNFRAINPHRWLLVVLII